MPSLGERLVSIDMEQDTDREYIINFGTALRRARLAKNMSRRKLCRLTGYPLPNISTLENGAAGANPRLHTMSILAAAVGKPLHEMLSPASASE